MSQGEKRWKEDFSNERWRKKEWRGFAGLCLLSD